MVSDRALLVVMCVSLSSAVSILSGPPLSCGRQDLNCTVSTGNCLDRGWLKSHKYTPSAPEELQVSVDTRQDEAGHLQPVLNATWKLRDEGSISYLTATELHVLVVPTNHNLCVRYSFKDKLGQRDPSNEKWSFSADMLVLVPGEKYRVSVFNIPKPELDHTSYDVSTDVTVPGCHHPKMQMTQFCIETGSLWQSNISVAQITADSGKSALAVSFNTDKRCEEYDVIVSCDINKHPHSIKKNNLTTLNMSFILDKWPRSCCQFAVEVNPHFPRCWPDCIRHKRTQDFCTAKSTDAPDVSWNTLIAIGVVSMCIVMALVIYVYRRKSDKTAPHDKSKKQQQHQLKQPPKVLVIYSQDHHLYRDIVLKLCSFLRAKCGIEVLVDLLDSTSVSMVGRHRWLEWQRQQMKNPSDKILVLCSQGVQAKWRAMCGQRPVTLREDITSPTDDMLTPFLNLFLTDMHQAGMQSKYMVAYFGDISSELDVPSVFDIAVKYNLMKHFEEMYFRILDKEKYEPGLVNHIEGIGGDEYFHCPSGRDLKKAIDAFQAYQTENPDWFERECVENEEEVIAEVSPLIDQLQIPPVLECVPVIRDGLPVFIHEVEINENCNRIHILTPELNPEHQLSSVAELIPAVNPECKHLSSLDEVLTDHLYPHSPSPASVYSAEPVLNKLPPPRQNWLSLREEPLGQLPTEDDDEDSLLPINQPFAHFDQRSSTPQNSLDSKFPEPSCANIPSEYFPSSEISHPQPMDMEEGEGLDSRKAPNSGSDQGYSSKISSQNEPPFKEDPLVSLMRLQQQQFLQNPRYSDRDPEEPYEH
ncbi:interleukin 17 receptor A1a [Acanthochromis polyacanthus]|uniref:Interleukin-17 receptor A-like n=1 Tax=Acanthochromis polyacanthus TaxID=80966 RepID=A0A3Q1G4W1_9TELE|nr:interleukin 17 receptor A1a [Acanthochromis polyacanthus]